MTMALLLDGSLFILVFAVAVWTVAVRDSFAAVIGYAIYGLLLALVWVRLAAIDAALTEAAIGGGLTSVLLIRAAVRLRPTEPAARAEIPGPLPRIAAALLSGIVAIALAAVVLTLPDPAPTLAPQVAEHIASTGLGNAVTAVLLAFRATDTLLEAVVLIFALLAVWALTPDDLWGGRPGPRYTSDPHGLLAYLARLLPPLGIIVAIYVFWIGADLPGGKFQAGTLLAAMWLLATMAGLWNAWRSARATMRRKGPAHRRTSCSICRLCRRRGTWWPWWVMASMTVRCWLAHTLRWPLASLLRWRNPVLTSLFWATISPS